MSTMIDRVEQAAKMSGMSLAEFVTYATMKEALKTLEQYNGELHYKGGQANAFVDQVFVRREPATGLQRAIAATNDFKRIKPLK